VALGKDEKPLQRAYSILSPRQVKKACVGHLPIVTFCSHDRKLDCDYANSYARMTSKISAHPGDIMDTLTNIRVVAGVIVVSVLVLYIFYILTLSRALSKCSASSRTMEPGMVWLLLVPIVNLVWDFRVVIGLAKSLGNEFRLRNIPNDDPQPGMLLGITMCTFGACETIRFLGAFLGVLAFAAHLVLLILYWAKIAEFSRRLDQVQAMPGILNPMPLRRLDQVQAMPGTPHPMPLREENSMSTDMSLMSLEELAKSRDAQIDRLGKLQNERLTAEPKQISYLDTLITTVQEEIRALDDRMCLLIAEGRS
jgi:hypothetical protein